MQGRGRSGASFRSRASGSGVRKGRTAKSSVCADFAPTPSNRQFSARRPALPETRNKVAWRLRTAEPSRLLDGSPSSQSGTSRQRKRQSAGNQRQAADRGNGNDHANLRRCCRLYDGRRRRPRERPIHVVESCGQRAHINEEVDVAGRRHRKTVRSLVARRSDRDGVPRDRENRCVPDDAPVGDRSLQAQQRRSVCRQRVCYRERLTDRYRREPP